MVDPDIKKVVNSLKEAILTKQIELVVCVLL